jgi:hypothetical protein
MRADFLARFQEQYTMNAERGVHAAVSASSTPAAEEMFFAGASSEFGDNVELF